MKTISRNSTRKLAELRSTLKTCRFHGRDNGFAAVPADPERAWAALSSGRAKLTDNEDGTYTVQIHSNSWFKLSA